MGSPSPPGCVATCRQLASRLMGGKWCSSALISRIPSLCPAGCAVQRPSLTAVKAAGRQRQLWEQRAAGAGRAWGRSLSCCCGVTGRGGSLSTPESGQEGCVCGVLWQAPWLSRLPLACQRDGDDGRGQGC